MRFIFAALWLVTVPFVSTATAVPVEIIYTGLASGFSNYIPLCGVGCSFYDVPFMLTYQFNVPAGATSFSNSYTDIGFPFGFGTPTATASINIGGVFGSSVPDQANFGGTLIPGARDESIAVLPGGSISQSIYQALGYHQPGIENISTSASSPLIPDSLFASYFISSGLEGSGNFIISIGDGGIAGTLALDAIYVNGGIAAFPELSTWAMLLIGFAAIGFAGYRRSRQSPVITVGAIGVIEPIGHIGC